MERRKRRAARPGVGQVLTIGTALSVGLAFALGATGCGGGSEQKKAAAQKTTATAGESDTTIYRAANALPDAAAKLAGFQEFLKKHPQSALRGAAHRNVFLLTKEGQGAEAAMAYAKQVLATEKLPAARGMMHYVLYSEATDPAGRPTMPGVAPSRVVVRPRLCAGPSVSCKVPRRSLAAATTMVTCFAAGWFATFAESVAESRAAIEADASMATTSPVVPTRSAASITKAPTLAPTSTYVSPGARRERMNSLRSGSHTPKR